MKNLKQKLQNPFALVVQGFIAGTLLFWATAPGKSVAAIPVAPAARASAQG